MAVSTRTVHRQRDYSRLFIALAVLAAVMAIAPIAAALLGYGATAVSPRTAFATAPRGDYAVLGRSEGDADVISVAWASNPGAVTEIARVPHLPGFTSTGAVSPDGKSIALVSVDSGSPSHPLASLNVVGLETGQITVAARNVVPGQTPVWSPDNAAIAFSRMPAGNEARGPVQLIRTAADAKSPEVLLATFEDALGVFPVGFAADEKLVSIVISARGSVLYVGNSERGILSSGITRDWKLSPEGTELAFIDTNMDSGLRYLARTVSLNGDNGVAAQSLAAEVSALGTAWNPVTKSATFGVEPVVSVHGSSVDIQALSTSDATAGFDVPLAYSADGKNLVVTRWSGASFQEPGKPMLQLVSDSGRTNYESFTRFYGWSAR